jgi:hypothetical protein
MKDEMFDFLREKMNELVSDEIEEEKPKKRNKYS